MRGLSNPTPAWIGPVSADYLRNRGLPRVPCTPGVYLWIRGFQLDPECAVNPALFSETVEALLTVPFVRSQRIELRTDERHKRVTIRSGLIRLGELTIGGGQLTAAKRTHLAELATSDRDRLTLFQVLQESVAQFGPVLYVGQASDLRQRVHTHVTSGTDLLDLARTAGIESDHLLLYCLPLPNQPVETRTLVEQLLTHILIAPLTYRPG